MSVIVDLNVINRSILSFNRTVSSRSGLIGPHRNHLTTNLLRALLLVLFPYEFGIYRIKGCCLLIRYFPPDAVIRKKTVAD